MRRYLFGICLCLVLIAALRTGAGGVPALDESAGAAAAGGGTASVTGRVYWKTSQAFYLDSVVIQHTADGRQQMIPISDNLICECGSAEDARLGSTVRAEGIFQPFSAATNPGEFDFQEYYRTLGVGGKLSMAEWTPQGTEYSVFRETLYQLRSYWKRRRPF